MISSHMPAVQRRAASDSNTVLDTCHSAVIRRIAHFGPCPLGIFQGTAGPAEKGMSWFILPKGHRVKVTLLKNMASTAALHMEVD